MAVRVMSVEKKNAWDKVLFWARRLSYSQADNHPEWREEYEKAKAHLNEVKEKERKAKELA